MPGASLSSRGAQPVQPRRARNGARVNGTLAVNRARPTKREWIGPFEIQKLLDHCIDGVVPAPPESGSVYVVTQRPWKIQPNPDFGMLYVGGNTGRSARFRTRIGDLLADAFGFFGTETGHSSGGQSLHQWCRTNQINPLRLYIAWVKRCKCHRCLEIELFRELSPLLNKVAPSRCNVHG